MEIKYRNFCLGAPLAFRNVEPGCTHDHKAGYVESALQKQCLIEPDCLSRYFSVEQRRFHRRVVQGVGR